jgi:predicted nucleic-acid-binding protein
LIGLDTNILLRYFAQDDADQSQAAAELIDNGCTVERPGFIAVVVLTELIWVMLRRYEATRADVAKLIDEILRTPRLFVQEAEAVSQALRIYEASKADFADCLVLSLAAAAGCETVMTFDKTAARAGMTLVK